MDIKFSFAVGHFLFVFLPIHCNIIRRAIKSNCCANRIFNLVLITTFPNLCVIPLAALVLYIQFPRFPFLIIKLFVVWFSSLFKVQSYTSLQVNETNSKNSVINWQITINFGKLFQSPFLDLFIIWFCEIWPKVNEWSNRLLKNLWQLTEQPQRKAENVIISNCTIPLIPNICR